VVTLLLLVQGTKGLIMSTTKVQSVLFDVDGTLADSFMLGFSSTNSVLVRQGKKPITEEDYHQGTKFTTPRRLAWHVTGNPDDPIGEDLGRQFDELYVNLVTPTTTPLFTGIREMLIRIQAQHTDLLYGALSNAATAYVHAVMKQTKLDTLFKVQLGADAVPEAKPSGAGLLCCSKLLGVDPKKCIYVGDSPTDAIAASNAGFLCSVGVTWGSHSVENVQRAFSYTVYSVDELELVLVAIIRGQDLV